MHYKLWVIETPWYLPDIPRGVYVYADHGEACGLTSLWSVGAVIAALPAGPFVAPIAAAIIVARNAIRRANEDSGGKGLRLRYNFAVHVIDQIKRRGKGSSPCPPDFALAPSETLGENDPRPLPFVEPHQEQIDELLKLPIAEESDLD